MEAHLLQLSLPSLLLLSQAHAGLGIRVVVVTLPGSEGTSEDFMALPQHHRCGWETKA